MSDHVHLCLSIPPTYSVSCTVGSDEVKVRQYIREQKNRDRGQGQLFE